MNNVFISYDLHAPIKNYERVIATIKSLGSWARVNKSFWYVRTRHSAVDARKLLLGAMDRDDSFCVVDATNNICTWENLDPQVAGHLQTSWNKAY